MISKLIVKGSLFHTMTSVFIISFLLELLLILFVPISGFHLPAPYSTKGSQQQNSPKSLRWILRSSMFESDDFDPSINATTTVVEADSQTEQPTTLMKRYKVISMAQELRDQYGYLLNPILVLQSAQAKLLDAIMELEIDFVDPSSSSTSTTREDVVTSLLPGDWDLICTMLAFTAAEYVPSLFETVLLQNLIASTLAIAPLTNKLTTLTQRIRCGDEYSTGATSNAINRVDHVIEEIPPNQVSEIFTGSDSSSSSVIFVHDAEVVDESNMSNSNTSNFRNEKKIEIRLNFKSVTGGRFWNNAELHLNFIKDSYPQFNNTSGGSFTNTFVDEEYRISRSDFLSFGGNDGNNKHGYQQLCIFQKRRCTGSTITTNDMSKEKSKDDITDADDIAIKIEPPPDGE
jgi:hypothetical protein